MAIINQQLACQTCAGKGRQVALIKKENYLNPEGFLCHAWLCPGCGAQIGTLAIDEQPACERCGHQKRQPVKGGVDNPYQPGGGAIKDGRAFMDQMRGQSVPGGPG